MDKQQLEERISELGRVQPWNHAIELPFGLKTISEGQSRAGKNLVKWRNLEPVAKRIVKGKNVLDLGCNDGFFSLKCSELGANYVTGVDIDPLRIEKALFIKEVKELNNVDFINANVFEDKSCKNKKYDIVLCLGFLHRITDPLNLISAISKMTETVVFEWKYFPYDSLFPHIMYFEPIKPGKKYQDHNIPYFRFSFSALEEFLRRNDFIYFYRKYHDYKRAILIASKKPQDLGEFSGRMPFAMKLRLFALMLKTSCRHLLPL